MSAFFRSIEVSDEFCITKGMNGEVLSIENLSDYGLCVSDKFGTPLALNPGEVHTFGSLRKPKREDLTFEFKNLFDYEDDYEDCND